LIEGQKFPNNRRVGVICREHHGMKRKYWPAIQASRINRPLKQRLYAGTGLKLQTRSWLLRQTNTRVWRPRI